MQCPYPPGFLRTVYENTCAYTWLHVSTLLARAVATHTEEVTLSFDWEALHLYHCVANGVVTKNLRCRSLCCLASPQ